MSEVDRLVRTQTDLEGATATVGRASLVALSGADRGLRHTFDERVRVGSRGLAEVVLKDPKVSGVHCEVVLGPTPRLRDLGSKNGTWLGGHRIVEAFLPLHQPF